jgi:twitching motility protein PilT
LFFAYHTRVFARWTSSVCPEHPEVLTRYQNGLILVTGSVREWKIDDAGRALVEQINLERREHIITLEDPIEYVLEPKGCHITQREVHTHTLPPSAWRCAGRSREIPM